MTWARRLYARWLRFLPNNRISVRGNGHHIVWADAQLRGCTIEISGENNRLEFGPGMRAWGLHARLQGRGGHIIINARTRFEGCELLVQDDGGGITVGEGSTLIGPMLVAQEGRRVEIGADCLVAKGAELRSSDSHSVRDAASQQRLNPGADIVVKDHVWIGLQALVLKGVTIESHAVVAARSVVTSDVAAGTLVAGAPARVLRTGVTWDHGRESRSTPAL